MQVEVNGTRLWFDVDGPARVPDGAAMRERPTVVLVHGGSGSDDHSYFRPHAATLSASAQVVYLDLREHGRSGRGDPEAWTYEAAADDIAAFCDVLGIQRPIVLGHSRGGFVVALYGARHPGHAGGLVLAGTMARFDLGRLVEGIRRNGGDEVAELARRDYAGERVSRAEWDRVYAAFGPHVPDADALARRVGNPAFYQRSMDLIRRLDIVGALGRIDRPTLVIVGERDGIMPVECSQEIVAGLPSGIGQLEVIPGAGHFPWLDSPSFWVRIAAFTSAVREARA